MTSMTEFSPASPNTSQPLTPSTTDNPTEPAASLPNDADLSLYQTAIESVLISRDTPLAVQIARAMDADSHLDQTLWGWLSDRMHKAPDGIYAFVRARLGADAETNGNGQPANGQPQNSSRALTDPAVAERWLPRLKAAAQASLQVAIADGDWETIASWLKLIGREPSAYCLSDVFVRGVRLAQPRAHHEHDLAAALIALTAKRNQTALEGLLADAELLASLPENLRAALVDHEGDGLALLGVYGVDMFLIVIARATAAHHPALITPEAVGQVWTLLNSTPTYHVNGEYKPDHIIEAWLTDGAAWLDGESLAMLMRLTITGRREAWFHRLVEGITAQPGTDVIPQIADALVNGGRGASDVLALISQMVANGRIDAQGAVDLMIRLLRASDWAKSNTLMMAQLTRAIQVHPELTIDADALWHLLDVAADLHEDLITRVAAKRLSAELEMVEDDAQFVEGLVRLYTRIGWNAGARTQVTTWWRGFARAQHAGRLGRIDKVMVDAEGEAKKGDKSLGDLRMVMQTVMAFRRLVGKRSLDEFASAIATTFDVLQSCADAFDPSLKRSGSFDEDTMRSEIDAHLDELSPHTRKILANDLKVLANLIAEMGDNRSKASLRRRSEDVDRALMTGEQEPHSAIDTLKWLSGYLSGSHVEPDDEDG